MERVILVLDRVAAERLQLEGSDLLRNNEIRIIALPARSKDRLVQRLEGQQLLSAGSILVQSPFDSLTYVPLDQANNTYSLTKHLLFSELCGLLGASEVRMQQIDVVTKNGSTSFNAKGELLQGSAAFTSEMERQQYERFSRELWLHDMFGGGAPDIPAAARLLEEKNLHYDPQMASIFRAVQSSNPIRSRKIRIKLSSECKTNLQIVASLDVPVYAKVDPEYRHAVENTLEYELTYQVTFGSFELRS